MSQWEIVPGKTSEYWLELRDPEGWYTAGVKWDRCIHFARAYNAPFPDSDMTDYLHICDIDDLIKRLLDLKDLAQKHFKGWEG